MSMKYQEEFCIYTEKFEHLVESIIIETYFIKGYSTMPKVKMGGGGKITNETKGPNERLRHEIFVNLLKFSKC